MSRSVPMNQASARTSDTSGHSKRGKPLEATLLMTFQTVYAMSHVTIRCLDCQLEELISGCFIAYHSVSVAPTPSDALAVSKLMG